MKNIPTNIVKTTLPTVHVAQSALEIVGNMVSSYFSYKQNTQLIQHETHKIKANAKVRIEEINAELIKSLEQNEQNFKKEMRRLKAISNELASGAKSRSKIMNQVGEYTKMLSDTSLPMEVKAMIPELIRNTYAQLDKANDDAINKLNMMRGDK